MSLTLFNSLGEKIEFQLMKLSRDRRDPAKYGMILMGAEVIPAKVFYRVLTLLLCGQLPVIVGNFKIEKDHRDFVIMFGAFRYSFNRVDFLKIVAWALRQVPLIDAVAASQALGVAIDVSVNYLYRGFPVANHTKIEKWEEVWAKEDKAPVTVD